MSELYRVIWEVDVEAESPQEAAEIARSYQTRPDTTATVFTVRHPNGVDTVVDLIQEDEESDE